MNPSSLHPAALDPQDLLRQCEEQRTRGSGPGGQHRNKVETSVTLIHRPTRVTGAAGERRSLADNRREALFRLRINLALHHRAEYVIGAPPSAFWQSRCPLGGAGRIVLNSKHGDFPAMLAEALDVIAAMHFDTGKAAAVLGCTPSQLVKMLKDEPAALALVNKERASRGLRTLK